MALDFDALAGSLADAQGPQTPDPNGQTTAPAFDQSGKQLQSGLDAIAESEQRHYSVAEHLAYSAEGVALGAINTFGTSLRLISPDSVANWVGGTAGGDYYLHHKNALDTVADIGTAAIPGTIFSKSIQAGSLLHRVATFGASGIEMSREAAIAARTSRLDSAGLFSGDRIIQSLFTSGYDSGEILKGIQDRATYMGAKQGVIDFSSEANNPEWNALVNNGMWTKLSDTLKENVAFETGVLATMNQSDTLYPSDWRLVDHLAFGLPLPLGMMGVEAAYMKRQIATIAETAGAFGQKLRFGAPDSQLAVSRPGTRDLSLIQASEGLDAVSKVAQANPENKKLQETMYATKAQFQDKLAFNVKALGSDTPFKGVTLGSDVSAQQVQTVIDFATDGQKKYSLYNLVSIEPTIDPAALKDRKVEKLTSLNDSMEKLIAQKPTYEGIKDNSYYQKIEDIENQHKELGRISPVILEPGGAVITAENRAPIAQDTFRKADVTMKSGDKLVTKRFVWQTAGNQQAHIELGSFDIALPDTLETKDVKTGSRYFAGQEVTNLTKQTAEPGIVDTARKASDISELPFTDWTKLNTQSLQDRGRTQVALEKFVDHVEQGVKTNNLGGPIILDPRQNGLAADVALELSKRLSPAAFRNAVALPTGMSMEDVQLAKLTHGYYDYRQWQRYNAAVASGALQGEKMSVVDFAHYANLPIPEPGTMHPLYDLFGALHGQGETDFGHSFQSMTDVKAVMQSNHTAPEITPFLDRDISISGHMLSYNPDERQALMGVYRDIPLTYSAAKQASFERAQVQRSLQLQNMSQAATRNAPFAQFVFDNIHGTPLADAASDISTLANGSQRGMDAVVTRNFAGGESRAFQGMDALKDNLGRIGDVQIKALFKSAGYETSVGKLLAGADSNERLDELAKFIYLRRQGWVVKDAPEVAQNGSAQFVLDQKDSRNTNLWRAMFGEEMPTNQDKLFMPHPTRAVGGNKPVYAPFQIQGNALDVVRAQQVLDQAHYNEANFLRSQAGNGPIPFRNFHVPAINFADPFVTNIRDAVTGELYHSISGKSLGDINQKINQAKGLYESQGMNVVVEDAKTLLTYTGVKDEILDKMHNFTDPLAQTGGITGKQVGFGAMQDAKEVLQDWSRHYEQVFKSVMRRNTVQYFEPYVNNVLMMNRSLGRQLATGELTVPQRWLNTLYDNPTLNPNSAITKVYRGAEQSIDEGLQWLQGKLTGAKDLLPGSETFGKALENSAPDLKPVFDQAEQISKTQTPWTLRALTNDLNRLTTTLTLRMFELGQPMLHMTALGATQPAVMKSYMRRAGEEFPAWQKRIGPWANAISDVNNQAAFSPLRFGVTAMHDVFNDMVTLKDGSKVNTWKHAMDMGYLDHSIGEFIEPIVGLDTSKGSKAIRDVTNLLSKPTDVSYRWTRGLAFMGGVRMARDGMGMQDTRAIYSFANHIANQVVGDYRPLNKPQIFQGAIGAPLGLFTTFAWNYMQRMFKYIENKDTKALYTQLGTQAMMFGAQSLPGWDLFTKHFANNYDGTTNPVTGFRDRYGDHVADLFLHGTLSNLPKLFGAPDGISLYTRGEAGIRGVPTIFSPADAPVVRGMQAVAEGLSKVTDGLRDNGVHPLQIAQALAQYSMNRPFKNLVDMISGSSVDTRGRIINDEVMAPMSVMSRVIGLKPMQEVKNGEAWNELDASRVAREHRMNQLEDTVRYNIRQGNYSGKGGSDLLAGHLLTAVNNGLDPSGMGEWLRNNYMNATVDRNTFEMISKITNLSKTSKGMEDVKKYLWSQVPESKFDWAYGGVK